MSTRIVFILLCALLAGACKEASIYPTDPAGNNPPPSEQAGHDTAWKEKGAPPLTFGTWTFRAFELSDGTVISRQDEPIYLTFTDSASYVTAVDCERIDGKFTLEDSTAKYTTLKLSWTDGSCTHTNLMDSYRSALDAVNRLWATATDLKLYYANGTKVLHYVRMTTPSNPFRFRGKLEFKQPMTLPANTRVMVAWYSETGPDFYFLWGEGTIDMRDSSFTIGLDDIPPVIATNYHEMAVGVVFLTTDQTLSVGQISTSQLVNSNTLGLSMWNAVFYRDSVNGLATTAWPWLTNFPMGYSTGRGYLVAPADRGTTWGVIRPDAGDPVFHVYVDDWKNLGFIGID